MYDQIIKILGDENGELLKKMCDTQSQLNDVMSVDNYSAGFRDGEKLMIDVLLGKNENLK